ncbi:MAG: type VI secretion system contractile sheath large subunit [Gammaproteobacteria bacterium]
MPLKPDRATSPSDKERVRLVYNPANQQRGDVELPFRLLVLGDFGATPAMRAGGEPRPIRVDRYNFDRILAGQDIQLGFIVDDRLLREPDGILEVTLTVNAMGDFGPDSIVRAVPALRRFADFRDSLVHIKEGRRDGQQPPPLHADHLALLSRLGYGADEISDRYLDLIITEIVGRLSEQMDAILHHEAFQAVESAWRGLRFLVDQSETDGNCWVDFLSIPKDELEADFLDSPEIQHSLLYRVIYSEEYGQFGGSPFGALIGNYQFSARANDIALLDGIANVAAAAHAPFIAAAAPAMFGVERYSALPAYVNLSELFEQGVQYTKWRGFRRRLNAQYIGLVLPGFLLRAAYDYREHGLKAFPYRERVTSRGGGNLWGNGAFAYAGCLLRSFIRYRWCLDIVGADGGRVDNLTWAGSKGGGGSENAIPTEILVTERREAELAEAGFITLTVHRGDQSAAFYTANSVQLVGGVDKLPDRTALESMVHAQLPYLFVISRIAHYLKVIQRDNIGVSKTRAELQTELNDWLVKYVSDMDNPPANIRGKRPLRKARIEVEKSDTDASWFVMRLTVVPHFRFMGAAFSLSLRGRIGDAVAELSHANPALLEEA